MSEFGSKNEFRPGTTIKKTLEPIVVIGAITTLLKYYFGLDIDTASALGILGFSFIRGIVNWIKNHNW